MNSTVKRKFNAILQRSPEYGHPDRNSRALTVSEQAVGESGSSPYRPRTAGIMATPGRDDGSGNSSSFAADLQKKRRLAHSTTTTPSKYATAANSNNNNLQGTPGMRSSPASIRSVPPNGTNANTTTTVSNVTMRAWGTPSRNSSRYSTPAHDNNDNDHTGRPPPPKYCPNDRDQLLRRLATFQELTDWTPKPERVNEVEWAKRGWACQGKERVRCALCGRELVVRVNKKEVDGKEVAVLIASEVAESVVDTYVGLIGEAHAEDCLWRKRGCDDSLLRLPLPNPKLALQGLRQRYDELCERAAFLPYEFNLRLPPGLDLDAVISYLPPDFLTNNPPSKQLDPQQEINRPALALALLGWQSLLHPQLNHPIPNSASCHTCLRRLGLWMFKSREIDPDTRAVLVPAPMDHLDPLREHRFFCPWKNPAAQRNPGSNNGSGQQQQQPAWEVLVLGLKNEAFIRNRLSGTSSSVKRTPTAAKDKRFGLGLGHSRSKSSMPAPNFNNKDNTTGADTNTTPPIPQTPERRPMTVDSGHPHNNISNSSSKLAALQGNTPLSIRSIGSSSLFGHRADDGEEENEEEVRAKKDKDMMSRLRRVKSLFGGSKSGSGSGGKLRKLGSSSSRPGTAHSVRSTLEGGLGQGLGQSEGQDRREGAGRSGGGGGEGR